MLGTPLRCHLLNGLRLSIFYRVAKKIERTFSRHDIGKIQSARTQH
jgi:hypothetical protein